MPGPERSVFNVRAKTGDVVHYHRDGDQPGKPLYLLIPGGLLALAALAMMFWVAYATWYQGSLPRDTGLSYLFLLTPVYAGSVFLFSYAYELYDVSRALRLTAVLFFFAVAALIIAAALFALFSKNDDSSSGSSADSLSSSRNNSTNGLWGGDWVIDLSPDGLASATSDSSSEAAQPEHVLCLNCRTTYVRTLSGVCPHCGAAQPQTTATA